MCSSDLECGKEVSDNAVSCPNCGNPINAANNPGIRISAFPDQPLKIEPEITSKKWKKVKLTSWLVIVSGFIIPSFLPGSLDSRQAFGWTIVFFGVIALIVGHIGAWYADKRTR